MNFAFFIRHFTERGTEVSVYNYAKYNEEILNNKSYIICFTEKAQQYNGFPNERVSYDKFNSRFPVIEIDNIDEMEQVIEKYNLSFFYTQTHGGPDIYKFDNKKIWNQCKTIKHCVFNTTYKEGDFYLSISNMLNKKLNTDLPVLPLIVDLPDCDETLASHSSTSEFNVLAPSATPLRLPNLRNELKIPLNAIVFGRYGGKDEFNIKITHQAIIEYLNMNNNNYFLFMNTNVFYEHPRIIYLDKNIDCEYKVKFINTCDVMIHARQMGETFGLSIGEFSKKYKPIITCPCGDLEHIHILGEKAILYNSKEELLYVFNNINTIIYSRNYTDWKCYDSYSPEYVMNLFMLLISNNK